MARRPKDITNDLLAASSRARGAIDEVVQSGEFMNSFLLELRKETPGNLSKLIESSSFFLTREKQGYVLHLRNKEFPGKILAIYTLGAATSGIVPYKIPKSDSEPKLIYMPNVIDNKNGKKGIFRWSASKDGKSITHPAIAPDKFIYRAWHRTLNRYTMRIKRAIEQGIRGK